MKEIIRIFSGQILSALGMTEPIRSLYLTQASRYVGNIKLLKGAWIRRSCTSASFVPLVSDIDLTVLIELKDIEELMNSRTLMPKHLIQDVQILSTAFLRDWEQTGGFRNRQIPSWKKLLPKSPELSIPETKKRSELAFELAHEVFILYAQLASKLSEKDHYSILKLGLELERLVDFWHTQDTSLLFVPRNHFATDDLVHDFSSFINRQEHFWGELLESLEKPMGDYSIKELMEVPGESGSALFLRIRNRPVYLQSDLRKFEETVKEFPEYFIATPNFIRLLKGVGVQEQNLLNAVAATRDEYFVRFCRQRLAHDLIGTLLQDSKNSSRLYFCFQNIQEFLESLGAGNSPGWDELDRSLQTIPWNQKDLVRISMANLEVLERVR